MSITTEGFREEQLQELASFRDVEAITKELKAIASHEVDVKSRASLAKAAEDLDRIEQLDLTAAHEAFRLDIVKEGEGFLPLLSRLSLLYGFDPEHIARQNKENDADNEDPERTRIREPHLYGQVRGLISIGSRPFARRAHPIGDSHNLERELLSIETRLAGATPGPIGMQTYSHYFVGQAASPDVLVAEEPQVVMADGKPTIAYEIPTRLHGITNVEVDVPYGKPSFDPTKFGDLFTEVDGEIIAHPTLESVVSVMSARPSYGLTHSPYIGQRAIDMSSYNFSFYSKREKGRRR